MKNKYKINDTEVIVLLKRRDGTFIETSIDIEDFERANDYKGTWYALWSKFTESFYVAGNYQTVEGKWKLIYLHRWIMGDMEGYQVDHVSHETLNNRRNNLRHLSVSLNQHHRLKANKNSKTGVRGVSWCKREGMYQADIMIEGEPIKVGYFITISEAEDALIKFRNKYIKFE